MGKSFLDQFAAFNCVGISERVEELECWSVPSSGERVSIMLDCMVDSARSKALDRRLRARCCVDHHPEHIVQLRETSTDVGPTSHQRGLRDFGAATQKLRYRVVEIFIRGTKRTCLCGDAFFCVSYGIQ